jgi:hypothetical protein
VTTRVKNDNSYLDEWVDHYLKIGFDHVVIYDNISTDPVLPKWGDKVSIFLDKNEFRVFPPFNTHDFIINLLHPVWLLHVDIDEFLILYKHKQVNDFLKRYINYGGVVINWSIYGSSGYIKRPEGLVKDNYVYRTSCDYAGEEGGNCIGKVAINTKYFKGIINPHYAISTRNIVNEKFEKTLDGVTKSSYEYCRLNHYYTRSQEEWEQKVNRGNGNYFQKRNLREIENIDKYSTIYDPVLKSQK